MFSFKTFPQRGQNGFTNFIVNLFQSLTTYMDKTGIWMVYCQFILFAAKTKDKTKPPLPRLENPCLTFKQNFKAFSFCFVFV